nr:hypothetical protein [Salinibacter altiplanensis]
MRKPRERGSSIYEAPGAAKYETTLDLSEPTRVRITAEGPLDYPHAMQTATKTMLLMPGEDATGDGITLTLHGFIVEVFIVEVLSPAADDLVPGEEISVRARVQMRSVSSFTDGVCPAVSTSSSTTSAGMLMTSYCMICCMSSIFSTEASLPVCSTASRTRRSRV